MRAPARKFFLLAATVAAVLVPATAAPQPAATPDFLCCYTIPSGAMKPTMQPGERFGLVKYSAEPQRGDVVIFVLQGNLQTPIVKRIAGLPGDRVQMVEGALHLNGEMVKRERLEDYIDTEDGKTTRVKHWRETLPNGVSYQTLDLIENSFFDNTQVYAVPEGHYFVLGDNRDNSTDSRALSQIGYVPANYILGLMKRP
jgi:signal peptidase I